MSIVRVVAMNPVDTREGSNLQWVIACGEGPWIDRSDPRLRRQTNYTSTVVRRGDSNLATLILFFHVLQEKKQNEDDDMCQLSRFRT